MDMMKKLFLALVCVMAFVLLGSCKKEVAPDTTSNLTFDIEGVEFTMVLVEGGTFTMGATAEQDSAAGNEKPAHQVTLSNYYIGQTEVTHVMWNAVMGRNYFNFQDDDYPVTQVTWTECQAFVEKLNQLTGRHFRLPTEAEWEYAARGGNKSKGFKYPGSNTLGEVAWYSDNSGSHTHPVATKLANELGLYDMSGNVWEWCQDWYVSYSSTPQTNPQGPDSGTFKVNRGGGFFCSTGYCRTSSRNYGIPENRSLDFGFRLCLSE